MRLLRQQTRCLPLVLLSPPTISRTSVSHSVCTSVTFFGICDAAQNIYRRLRSNKRGSDHLGSNEPPNIKRPKQDEEEEGEGEGEEIGMKESKKLNAVVQNGLYVAEMFEAQIARQHVIPS